MKALLVAGALLLGACQPQVVTKVVEVPAPKSDYQECVDRVKVTQPTGTSPHVVNNFIVRLCGYAGVKP